MGNLLSGGPSSFHQACDCTMPLFTTAAAAADIGTPTWQNSRSCLPVNAFFAASVELVELP